VYAAAVKAQKAEAASKMHANNVKAHHHKPKIGRANLKWPHAQAAPQDKENKKGILEAERTMFSRTFKPQHRWE
jgi:hypothetical protein